MRRARPKRDALREALEFSRFVGALNDARRRGANVDLLMRKDAVERGQAFLAAVERARRERASTQDAGEGRAVLQREG